MLRTVDLDAVSSLNVFASSNEHSCHVTSLARPTPPPGFTVPSTATPTGEPGPMGEKGNTGICDGTSGWARVAYT